MRTCGVLVAVVLAIIMVPLLVFTILFNGFAQTVLSSTSFVAKLNPKNLQSKFNEALPYLIATALQNPEESDSKQLFTSLFPDPTMQTIASTALPQLITAMNGDYSTTGQQSVIDTTLDPIITTVLSDAPACTQSQESAMAIALKGQRPLGETLCNPQDATVRKALTSYITTQLRDGLSGKTLLDNPDNPTTTATMADITTAIATLKASATQSVAWPAILLVLIIAFAVRSLRELFGWLGTLLVVSGLLGLPIAFLNKSLVTLNLHDVVMQNAPKQAGIFLPFLTIFDDAVFVDYVQWITHAYYIMVGVGVVLVIVALTLRQRNTSSNTVLAPLPGTPYAQVAGNDGTTAPVAVEVDTEVIPVGDVTKPLSTEETSSTTDSHKF
ncbi:MAG: hypothetical protein EBS29_12585 [Chloroflexia bacterium]|nr:hypothetical protein [Chloroflexia bacterium]